jgi:cohesin complex subunit SA-1/2
LSNILYLIVELSSRDVLEREYLFIDVISTFLRAIRVGAIHIHHGAVVLAHYGRLEVSFDTCSKAIVDVLREESIMNDSPDVIVTTVTQALQEVSYIFYRFLL